MKTLLLLRHAKSSWDEPGIDDHDRPLKKRGRRDAPAMGQLIREQDLRPECIISSTARRARETTELVSEACGYTSTPQFSGEIYEAPPERYLSVLHQLPNAMTRILVVGHNPGMEELLEGLTGQGIHMPTAALAQLELPIDSWQELTASTKARLVHFWIPKELA